MIENPVGNEDAAHIGYVSRRGFPCAIAHISEVERGRERVPPCLRPI
jgi:hypothetical protein